MSNSLADQLKSLGLVDEKKTGKALSTSGLKTKEKVQSTGRLSTEALTAEAHAKQMAEKAAKDKAIEAERRAVREKAERLAQARDIIKSQGALVKGEDKKYRFTHGKKIKEFWVSSADFERLAKGLVGAVQLDKRWYLIEPAAIK